MNIEVNNVDLEQPSYIIGDRPNIKVLNRIQTPGLNVEIFEYTELLGMTNTYDAQSLFFMQKANIRARQIAFYINNSGVKIQPGAMSYFQGSLEMVSGVTVGNAIGRIFSGALTGEAAAMPEYSGNGVLVLEPSFKHFIPLILDAGEQIIVDKGMFYCAAKTVKVTPIANSTISSALLGGEGIFQIQMIGPGLVILESAVPACEITKLSLNNDILRVDGNFAIMRTGNIQFTVERSAKTLMGSVVSGEGLVNVFRGTGEVWIAPTLKVYEAINLSRGLGGDVTSIDMNTSTGKAKQK